MLIKVCSSTISGKCDEFNDQVLCGDCYVGEAGRCLSASSVGRQPDKSNDLLADATVLSDLDRPSCSANQTLETWVRSKHPERQQ